MMSHTGDANSVNIGFFPFVTVSEILGKAKNSIFKVLETFSANSFCFADFENDHVFG